MTVLAIAGSPSPSSRTQLLLTHLLSLLDQRGFEAKLLAIPTLPAEALVRADVTAPAIGKALADVAQASIVIFGTPIYKASYSGLLKTFLDLLPQDGLDGKIVLPVATGGSHAHLLALDYALRPVLQALGADAVLPSVFALDREVVRNTDGNIALDARLSIRVANAADRIRSFADRLLVRPYTAASGICPEAAAPVAA